MQDIANRRPKVFVIGVPLLRWGLEKLIDSAGTRYEIAGSAVRVSDALEVFHLEAARIAVLVVDTLPIPELTDFCRRCLARTLLVTGSADEAWLDQAAMAGVQAMVRTSDSPDRFLRALEELAGSDSFVLPRAGTHIVVDLHKRSAGRKDPEQSKIGTLTVRERQTIAALASDAAAPGKVIADRLCMSEHTLRNHLTSIYNKLGLANRLDLYAYALRHALGELSPPHAPVRDTPPRTSPRVP